MRGKSGKENKRERSAGEKREGTWRHVTRLMVAQWGDIISAAA